MRSFSLKLLVMLCLLASGSLAAAAEKRELSTDLQLLARAKQQGGQHAANHRAIFGLSQREDLKEVRAHSDKQGLTHTRYRQTVEGVPVWGEQIIISRDRSGAIVGVRGTLVTGLDAEVPQILVSLTAANALDAMKDKVKNNHPQAKDLSFKNETSELVVYIDNKIPKLSYAVSFFADTDAGGHPTRPHFVVDALTGAVLFQYEGLAHAATTLLSQANINGAASTWNYYTVTVSAGQKALYVTTSGLNGDADLYVRFGSQPTTAVYDCESIGSNSNESCVVNSPQAGTWHIGIYAWAAYTGVSLSAKQFSTQDSGSGPGGNLKTGQYSYGPSGATYPAFSVLQDGTTCIMNDANVKTVNLGHGTSGSAAFVYTQEAVPCKNSYNTTGTPTINGAYTPLNDAHYFGAVVYKMYQDWLGVPPLTFQLTMRVHYSTNYENAFWDGSSMTFGDGATTFYPLVSLDVSAHEVSHGFTEQKSNLTYSGQSGGINEAFSDMAGEAAEYYMRGSNDFKVGYEIYKSPTGALRYMCNPPQDGRSIDNASQYYDGLDVHYSSGVFNKAFCLLATSPGWTTRKAFETFAHANMNYWTPSATFVTAARGVYDAACDAALNTGDVVSAFANVGVTIDTTGSACAAPSDSPPAVSMIAPGNPVSGTAVTLSANASDDHGVNSVQFFVDNISIGFGTLSSGSITSGVWSINNWNSTSVSNGNHSVTAKATDNASPAHTTTSAAVTVNVNNPPASIMHVGGLGKQSVPVAGGKWNARVTITIHDSGHGALGSATVSGTWSGGASGSGSCTTASSGASLGTCTVTRNNLKSGVTSVTFTVNTVTRTSYTYDATKNEAGLGLTPSVTVLK